MKHSKRILLTVAALTAFFGGYLSNLSSAERFDHEVRNDFFAGFAGNADALARGIKKTEAVLASDPNHAEAMVWLGAGIFFQSGQAFQKGDQAKGMELYGKSLGMMQRAVELEPKNIGVRIPRGATILSAARQMPPQMARPLFTDGLSDYLAAYDLQKNALQEMSTHARGELLLGIADSYSRLGDTAKAEEFFTMVKTMLPDSTPYAKSATKWLATKELLAPREAGCFGCHTGK
jgi:tetratricopeptide (TPR) repeat protein